MSNTSTMPRPRVITQLSLAEKCAFLFTNLEKKLKDWAETKTETLNHIGGKVSPFWIFMSIIGILAAIGFGIYAAFNAQGAIAGIIDPMGNGTFPVWIYLVIGAAISIVGMLFGHFIYEGLSDGFKNDEHTGERLFTPKIWFAVVGFIGAILYVSYQFVLVKSAGAGNVNTAYLPYVVAGIAILELLIGALILHKAFAYIVLFIITIIMAITTRNMNTKAKSTNDYYRQYLNFLSIYNNENPANLILAEGNNNIRRAIAYYTGTKLPEENTPPPAPIKLEESVNTENTTPDSPSSNIENKPKENTPDGGIKKPDDLDTFFNDTTDADLTF